MTGNEWMFYSSLTVFVVLLLAYLPIRIWIELHKWRIKKNIQEELEGRT